MDDRAVKVAVIARGETGYLRWSYYAAAQLESYTIDCTDRRWVLEAKVVLKDAFKLAQRPLVFVAPYRRRQPDGKSIPAGQWSWPVEQFWLGENNRIVAHLGQPLF